MRAFRLVPLGEILTFSPEEVTVELHETYRPAGIYSFGRGLFGRHPISGSETRYKTLYQLHEGQLVYGRLNAWEGAIAVVTPAFRGMHVSQEFPTFDIDRSRALPAYLGWVCRWEPLWAALMKTARGMGSRAGARRLRVHPDQFLSVTIPLPNLDEQGRVASKLKEVFGHLRRIQSKADASVVSTEDMVTATLGASFEGLGDGEALGNSASVVRGKGPVYLSGSGSLAVNQACVRWGGLDILRAREVDPGWAASVPSDLLTLEGDVLVNSTGEGTIGRACVVSGEDSGYPFDSHLLVVRTNPSRLLPRFLAAYLRSPQGRLAVERVKGANTTKQTELGKRKLEEIRVPLPSVNEQEETIRRLDSALHRITSVQAAAGRRAEQMKGLASSVLNTALSGHL